MIRHNVVQGGQAWLKLRAGIPTASEFDRIVTPKGKLCTSEASTKYMHGLLAERILGRPTVAAVTTWMNRGTELEAQARSYYEFQRDVEIETVGLLTNDAGTIGASPDGFAGTNGLLEIKVPSEAVHVGYLLGAGVDKAYKPQVQGQLWISGREWADTLSYHPEMPPALARAERDEEFIALLSEAVEEFSARLEMEWARLLESGIVKLPEEAPAAERPEEFITDSDLSALMADRFPDHKESM